MIPIYNTLNRLNKLNITGKLHPTPVMWHNYSDTTLAVTPLSSTSMGLTWTNPAIQGATLEGVLVYRGTDGVNFSLVDTLGVVTSGTDTELTEGTSYYYRLAFRSSRGVVTGMGVVVSGTTFDAMSQAYFAAMTTQLDTPSKIVINTAIRETSSILSKCDFVNLALATEQQSLLNIANPAKTAIKVNSPTFVPYNGWYGDATNYINTQFNPVTATNRKLLKDAGTLLFYNNNSSYQINSYMLTQGLTIAYNTINIFIENSALLRLNGNYNRNSGAISIMSNSGYNKFISFRRLTTTSVKSGINKTYSSAATPGGTSESSIEFSYARNANRLNFVLIGGLLTDSEIDQIQDSFLPVFEYFGSDYESLNP